MSWRDGLLERGLEIVYPVRRLGRRSNRRKERPFMQIAEERMDDGERRERARRLVPYF